MVSTLHQVDSDDPSATVTGGEIQRADVHQWETTAGRVSGAKTVGVDFNKNVTGEHKCRCNRMFRSKVKGSFQQQAAERAHRARDPQ